MLQFKLMWTKEAINLLKDRYEKDGPKKLSLELDTTTYAVTAKARRLGIKSTRKTPPKGFKWTKSELNVLKERYISEGGKTIAKEFGLAIDTVRRKASSLGLHTIVGHAEAGRVRSEKSTSCDIHYFDKWSPNMAYILGFSFADGNIDKQRICLRFLLSRKDRCVLEFIKKELKCKSKIHDLHYKDYRGWNVKPQSLLIVSNKVLVRRLGELGVHPRKTFNDDPFPNVPDDMMPHFVRGYLDGDGSISIGSNGTCSINFVGSPRFIVGLTNSLIRLLDLGKNTVQYINGKKAVWSSIAWSSLNDLLKLDEFLYSEHYFCLKRKRNKLDLWLSVPRRSKNEPKLKDLSYLLERRK